MLIFVSNEPNPYDKKMYYTKASLCIQTVGAKPSGCRLPCKRMQIEILCWCRLKQRCGEVHVVRHSQNMLLIICVVAVLNQQVAYPESFNTDFIKSGPRKTR